MLQDTKFAGYAGADGTAPRASHRGRSIENGSDPGPQAQPRLFLLGEDTGEPLPAFEPAPAIGILPAGLSKVFIFVVVAAVLTVAILIAASLSFRLFAVSSHVKAVQTSVSVTEPIAENEATTGVAATSPNAVATPTRSEISAAFNTAYQNRIDLPQAAITVPAVRKMDRDELAGLIKRARALIAAGDIAPARLLLLRAADAREPSAALLLAQTYDPAVLGRPDVRSLAPDPEAARQWYRKATEFGSSDSKQLAEIKN
jgi:hypothetical protein